MSEPDELYTLRAQYWLGHYNLALEEGKSIMRRPMSPELKAEREEFMLRCQMALGQQTKVIFASGDTPALRALILKAQFETATDEASKQGILQELQSLLGESSAPDTGVQLAAAHIYLAAGLKKEALQCVHMGQTLEHMSLTLQLFVQLDRLDLAQNQCSLLRKTDEDSILTQLGGVYMALAKGSSVAGDAIHTLNQLSEQYGPSVFLLNLMACALMQQGKYSEAESKLEQSRQEFGSEDADTLVNLIVAYQYQSKSTDALVQQLKETYPDHFLAKGLEMVQGAFERESGKYQVAA